jgi:hypothetical protein
MNISMVSSKEPASTAIRIHLDSDEVAIAIAAYLVAHNVIIKGPHTIRVNNELIEQGSIYIDPSGLVVFNGTTFTGRIQ